MAVVEICDVCGKQVGEIDGISLKCSDMNGLSFTGITPTRSKRKYKIRVCDECMDEYSSLNGQSYGFGGFKLVDPSTICQCTGLKDNNGKLIWENDIMRYQWGGKIRIDVIKYEPPIFTYSKSMRWNLQQDEVIGNIFDNPEFLEREG